MKESEGNGLGMTDVGVGNRVWKQHKIEYPEHLQVRGL